MRGGGDEEERRQVITNYLKPSQALPFDSIEEIRLTAQCYLTDASFLGGRHRLKTSLAISSRSAAYF